MRTAPIDVAIGGQSLRVVCDDEGGADLLRSALDRHLAEGPAPLAFYLQVPTENEKLFVLLDRSGLVLARARRLEDCLATLGGHLSAFLQAPERTARFVVRGLMDDQGLLTLALPPLLQLPPLVERRLASVGYRIVDRLAVDVDRDARVHLTNGEWPGLADLPDGVGHVSYRGAPAQVGSILLPGAPGPRMSMAQVIAAVAAAGSPGHQRDSILDITEALADVHVEHLDPGQPDAVYRLLSRRH